MLDKVALALFFLAVFLLFTYMHRQGETPTKRWDFQIYYGAAQIIRHGGASRLYDLGTQAEYQMRYVDGTRAVTKPDWPFISPPAAALLFLPLTVLPIVPAFAVWTAINLVLLLASIRLVQRPLGIEGDWPVFLAPVFLPVTACIVHGNISVVLLLLYAIGFVQTLRGRPFLAGCAVGLSALKFQLMVGFLAVLFLRRFWRFLAGAATGTAIIAVVSGLIVGWQQLAAYPAYLRQMSARAQVSMPQWMMNVRGFLRLITGHDHPVWLLASISAVLIVGAAIACKDAETGYAIALITATLASYYVYMNDGTVLIIPLAVAVARVQQKLTQWSGLLLGLAIPIISFGLIVYRLHPVYAPLSAALLLFLWKSTPQRDVHYGSSVAV